MMNISQKEKDVEINKTSRIEKLKTFTASDEFFYAWECMSLVMANRTTVDFVIKDNFQMMCLLHVLQNKLNP